MENTMRGAAKKNKEAIKKFIYIELRKRAKKGKTITYGQLKSKIEEAFKKDEVKIMAQSKWFGSWLGELSHQTNKEHKILITVLVCLKNKEKEIPGEGFFIDAQKITKINARIKKQGRSQFCKEHQKKIFKMANELPKKYKRA